MATTLATLATTNTELRQNLNEELERQRFIESLLKDTALQETRIETYLTAVQNQIEMGSVESGDGVSAVQTRLDTLHADHFDKKDISQGRLSRLEADIAQLVEAGHPSTTDKVQAAESFAARIKDVNTSADNYSDRLAKDLEREQNLVAIRKDFVRIFLCVFV